MRLAEACYLYIRTHMQTQARIRKHTQMRTHARTYAKKTRTQKNVHKKAHTYTRAHVHTHTRTHAYTHTRAHAHAYTRTHVHMHTRTHTHTHTHTHCMSFLHAISVIPLYSLFHNNHHVCFFLKLIILSENDEMRIYLNKTLDYELIKSFSFKLTAVVCIRTDTLANACMHARSHAQAHRHTH